jgi:RNA polymerase sigma factor (sigma-70 family)
MATKVERDQNPMPESVDAGVFALKQDNAAMQHGAVEAEARLFLAVLFDKYRAPLFRYLRGLVPSADDAAELVQESYARFLRHPSASRLEAVARSYLFQTATNLARDHFRRRATHHSGQHCDVDEVSIADQASDPEQTLVWAETIESIKQGIKELRPVTRRVFLLSRFRNKSYSQIGGMLGLSTRTVERRMSEAVAELSKRIGGRV